MRLYEYVNELRLHAFAQLRDPLLDLIGYKVVCDVRNTSDFAPCLWFAAVLSRKYSAIPSTYEFTHALS